MCFSRIVALFKYWQTSPPVHEILAARYLDPGKRGHRRSGPSEEQSRNDMGQVSAMLGVPAKPLPDHLKEMIRAAEQLKTEKKGF
jgi:hypothetical protein